MANVHLKVVSVDKGQFVNEKKKCMKFMDTNSSCNNSIKLCDVHFVANFSKMQLVINVKTANTHVTKNVMDKVVTKCISKTNAETVRCIFVSLLN